MRLVPKNIESYNNDNLIELAQYSEAPKVSRDINVKNVKDRDKVIKHIETLIRSSIEYKDYIKFLKTFMNKDTFFSNVEQTAYNKVKIELHHSPLTLYDIVTIVLTKHEDLYGKINLFDIAEEVMKLHYQCKVGLAPLSKTTHKLVHDGKVFVTVKMVRGDWVSFYKEYLDYFPQDMIEKLKRIIQFSKEVQDVSLLETKYTYIKVDGFKQIQLINEK